MLQAVRQATVVVALGGNDNVCLAQGPRERAVRDADACTAQVSESGSPRLRVSTDAATTG